MAKVNFVINGRKYALGCDAGEEERLMRWRGLPCWMSSKK